MLFANLIKKENIIEVISTVEPSIHTLSKTEGLDELSFSFYNGELIQIKKENVLISAEKTLIIETLFKQKETKQFFEECEKISKELLRIKNESPSILIKDYQKSSYHTNYQFVSFQFKDSFLTFVMTFSKKSCIGLYCLDTEDIQEKGEYLTPQIDCKNYFPFEEEIEKFVLLNSKYRLRLLLQ